MKERKKAGKQTSSKKLRLPTGDLRTLVARVVLSDPTLDTLDLNNHAQLIGLSATQKLSALEKLSHGNALIMVKLVSVGLDNACAPALAKLFRSQHQLQCVSFEGALSLTKSD